MATRKAPRKLSAVPSPEAPSAPEAVGKKKEPKPPKGLSPDDARAAIQADREQRVQAFLKGLNSLQQEYRVTLVPTVIIREGNVGTRIDAVAEE